MWLILFLVTVGALATCCISLLHRFAPDTVWPAVSIGRSGIVYFSKIPPFMKPVKLKHLMSK